MVTTTRKEGWVPPKPDPAPSIKFIRLSDIEPEEVEWLWYPYIPRGKLSMLEGDPGQGKSWITCAIASDLSAGRPLPGMKSALPPQKILMLSAEDGLGDTIRPRIEAMQGNMDNIFVSDNFFLLNANGIKDLEDAMRSVNATIVFLDPIVAYMGSKVDMHRSNEVREIMAAMARAAKATNCAIVAVRHLRKGGTDGKAGKAIYAGIGSIDFTAAVRSVMQVQETKGGTKFLFHAKHNLTPKGQSMAYDFSTGAFQWTGPLSKGEEEDVKIATKTKTQAKAEAFLKETLASGPQLAEIVFTKAAEAGIAYQTLQRMKKGIAISKKTNEGWIWCLEDSEEPAISLGNEKDELEQLIVEARTRLGAGK